MIKDCPIFDYHFDKKTKYYQSLIENFEKQTKIGN